jgi:CheY-like chemotaxis protein/predicted Ser/Thr protein kinase
MEMKKDILLVNRDGEFHNKLGNSLRQAGYPVISAIDMNGAMSALSANSISLVLCDTNMGDINGYEFLRFIKNDPIREKIPFVFLVPLDDQGRAFKAFKMGAADFIVYPLDTKEIITRISEVFESARNGNSKQTESSPIDKSSAPQIKPTEPDDKEKREGKRSSPTPPIRVEVSRNNILWFPGQIKNINVKGMFIKTSLLGKPGVELFCRITLPSGTSIVKGQVKHIAFQTNNSSAGLGVEIEKSTEWRDILKFIATFVKKGSTQSSKSPTDSPKKSSGSKDGAAKKQEAKADNINEFQPGGDPRNKDEDSLEIRFYKSLIGKQLNNYKVISFIGAGAMGGVFKGWDVALERSVALKVISYKLSAEEKFREMFIKEARLVSKLDHPNIAHIYYIGTEDQILFFVMEYVRGATMAKLIKQETKFNTLQGLNYIITICEALDFVRKKNIIHRDIKPANIMINDQDIVKIVDFGVAKVLDVKEKEHKKEGIVGSPFYISPESIEGSLLDHRSDIYSLGASFYHAFTGLPPFEGKDPEEILMKHMNGALIPLKKKNPKVSNSLGKIIEKMLAKKPDDRYQDYEEIIKAFKSLQSKAIKFQQLKNATLIFRVKNNKITI